MKAEKVIDNLYLQVYHVSNLTKDYKNEFPKQNVIITYAPETSGIISKNSADIRDPLLNLGYTYIFTTLNKEEIITKLKIKEPFDKSIEKDYLNNKSCGMNGVNQDIYTKNNNVVMSVMSSQSELYPINYIRGDIDILTNYKELSGLTGAKFKTAINKAVNSVITPLKTFNNLIKSLSKEFPLNYGGSIRRFKNTITENDLKKKDSNEYKYYIGYDIRYSNYKQENDLNKIMEKLTKEKDDVLYVYETYSNPIKDILKQCKEKKIKYELVYKYCIKIKEEDYDKLNLSACVSEYV